MTTSTRSTQSSQASFQPERESALRALLATGSDQWLRLDAIAPHPLAQRMKFDKAHAERMARNFKPEGLGVLTIARMRKTGKLWIVDGQHRYAAAVQWLGGDMAQQIHCNVVDVDTDAEAAELFLILNNHKSVRSFDRFLVRLVAKEPTALAVEAILAHHGLKINPTRLPGTVQAVEACEAVFSRQRGADMLDRVIGILRATWAEDNDAYNGALIRGLALLLARYGPAINQRDLVNALAKSGSGARLLGQARELAQLTRTPVAVAAMERMRAEYNRRRRTSRLEEPVAADGSGEPASTLALAAEGEPEEHSTNGTPKKTRKQRPTVAVTPTGAVNVRLGRGRNLREKGAGQAMLTRFFVEHPQRPYSAKEILNLCTSQYGLNGDPAQRSSFVSNVLYAMGKAGLVKRTGARPNMRYSLYAAAAKDAAKELAAQTEQGETR